MGQRTITGGGALTFVKRFAILAAAFVLLALGGWVQHLYTCFNDDRWGFLIAGAIFFPIAVIHGWGIWLGLW